MLIGVICLIASVGFYSISQLHQHGKLRWAKTNYGFFGFESYVRKYKISVSVNSQGEEVNFYYPHDKPNPPENIYYRFFKIPHRERFPLSATLLVFVTDIYHLSQFLFFLFLSLSITFAIGFDWWLLLRIWSGIHLFHFGVYKMFQR